MQILRKILRTVITDLVINTLLSRVTRHPAGMHCPARDDAFVSSLVLYYVDVNKTLVTSVRWSKPTSIYLYEDKDLLTFGIYDVIKHNIVYQCVLLAVWWSAGRVYFKHGVQPKCGVQNEKMWCPRLKNVDSKIAFLLQEISYFEP